MNLTLVCPDCAGRLPLEAAAAPDAVRCGGCQRTIPLAVSGQVRDDVEVDRCPVCEGGDFYIRKDFDPQLGLAVIITGALISAGFYWFGLDAIAYGVLGLAALIDLIVYRRCIAGRMQRGFAVGSLASVSSAACHGARAYAARRRQIQTSATTTAIPSRRRGPLTKTTAPLTIMNRNAPRTNGAHAGARRPWLTGSNHHQSPSPTHSRLKA